MMEDRARGQDQGRVRRRVVSIIPVGIADRGLNWHTKDGHPSLQRMFQRARDVSRIGFLVALALVLVSSMALWMSLSSKDQDTPGDGAESISRVLAVHDPIIIVGDTDFASQADFEGWPGDGSAASPYVIENYSIESGSPTCQVSIANTTVRFVISNCSVGNYVGIGILLSNITNCSLVRNICTGSATNIGMSVNSANYVTILGNTVTSTGSIGPTGSGLVVRYSENATVEENICSGGYPMNAYMMNHSKVADNSFTGGKFRSVDIQLSHNNTFTNNTCGQGMQVGVFVEKSPFNNWTRSTFMGNVWNNESSNNTYANNTFNNGQMALMLLSSDNLTVKGNWFNGTGMPSLGTGVELNLTQYSLFFDNTFSHCFGHAIYVDDTVSEHNTFWNNSFVYNYGTGDTYDPAQTQVLDHSPNNHWNSSDGYGNYWTDLQSPDDVPPDGIVDWSYNITGSGGSKDYFPLTTAPTPIPEFGMMPLIALGCLALMVLIERAGRRRAC